jgi:HlyD family secretion protein
MAKLNLSRWLWRIFTLALLTAGVSYGGWQWQRNQSLVSTPRYQTASISKGDLLQVVTASGQLNPVLKVEIGSQISGIIQKLLADFNSTVKEGQLIAQIDPGTYEASFIQAEGNLASAKAALELMQVSEGRAKALRVNKLSAEAEYDRVLADLHQAEAAVKISEGTLKKAQVDLARCKIYSPIDGIVISRDVNVGQTVAASLSAPKLFVIANDLSKMQIETDIAEADVGVIEVGQDAEFSVDALPGQTFQGKVTQIRNAPKADQNVVTYVTIVEVSNPSLKLKPGMTANVSIIVTHRENVLKIPNAALRFRPPKNVAVVKTGTNKTDVAEVSVPSDRKAESAKPKKDKRDKRKSERTAYVLRDAALQPVKLKLGITDGRETELIEGLQEGDAVVVDMSTPKENPTLASRILTVFKRKD